MRSVLGRTTPFLINRLAISVAAIVVVALCSTMLQTSAATNQLAITDDTKIIEVMKQRSDKKKAADLATKTAAEAASKPVETVPSSSSNGQSAPSAPAPTTQRKPFVVPPSTAPIGIVATRTVASHYSDYDSCTIKATRQIASTSTTRSAVVTFHYYAKYVETNQIVASGSQTITLVPRANTSFSVDMDIPDGRIGDIRELTIYLAIESNANSFATGVQSNMVTDTRSCAY